MHPTRPLHAALAAVASACALALAPAAQAADRSWNAGDGWFYNPAAWSPFGVAQDDDIFRIDPRRGPEGRVV